ncbi:MAG: hypothetical protein EBR79_03780, partial [Proteobacteria bacterium]|nr:hypothetical protein [Pseudomonadota bacterium]
LGTASLAQIYTLLESILGGKMESTLAQLDDFYANGQDALGIVQGLMDTTHLLTRLKLVPTLTTSPTLTELERTRAIPLASSINMANLSRLYQLLLHTLPEVKQAEQPYQALQMAIARIAYLAPLPPLDKLLHQAQTTIANHTQSPQPQSAGAMATPTSDDSLSERSELSESPTRRSPKRSEGEGGQLPQGVDAGAKAGSNSLPIVSAGLVGQEKTLHHQQTLASLPQTWPALVKLVRTEKPGLAAALENQVRCHAIQGTALTLTVEKGLLQTPDLLQQLRTVLKATTNTPWQIQTTTHNSPPSTSENTPNNTLTITEQLHKNTEELKQNAAHDPQITSILEMFPGAEIESVNSPTTYPSN